MLLILVLISVIHSFITAHPRHGNKLSISAVYFQNRSSTNICQNANSSFNVNCFCGNFTSFLKRFSHMIIKYHSKNTIIDKSIASEDLQKYLNQKFHFPKIHIFGNAMHLNMSQIQRKLANEDIISFFSYLVSNFSVDAKLTMLHPIYTKMYGIDIGRTFPSKKICINPEITKKIFKLEMLVSHNRSSCIQNTMNSMKWVEIINDSVVIKTSTCVEFHFANNNCVNILQKKDYIINSDRSITVISRLNFRKILLPADYEPTRYGIKFCQNSYIPEVILGIFSINSAALNIFSLILIILTFLCFKVHRTLANTNIVGLCIAILLSEIFFLIGMDTTLRTPACKVLVFLYFWSIYAEHMWLLIISISIFRKIKSIRQIIPEDIRKCKRNFLLAFLLPLGTAAVLFTLDFAEILKIRDGDSNCCWVCSNKSWFYLFFIPVSFVLIVTSTMLCSIIISIKYQQLKSSGNISCNEFSKIKITKVALKLVIILGTSEVFIPLMIFFPRVSVINAIVSDVFLILFYSIRGYRGVFLALIYIFNKKNLNLYCKCCKSLSERQHPSALRCEIHQLDRIDTNS